MFIFHIALQGCLKRPPIAYGCTADTGGHIKYLLELVDETSRSDEVTRLEIATRAFTGFDPIYEQARETYDAKTDIVRFRGRTLDYLAKEDLWREHEEYIANILEYLGGLEKKPDIIHAHYADAGLVAAHIKAALGIPYVFTAHSLGRVKLETLKAGGKPSQQDLAILEKRIAIEEEAIAHADGIIASSRDEAEGQYGLYRSARPERIRINPPGCDLAEFRQTEDKPLPSDLLHEINKFLNTPDRPPILALARPVRKKNLQGLVEAYGLSPSLQGRANLVIFAGTRDDLKEEAPENRAVLQELLYLIDKYDLHGKVALPKSHEPDHVPFIYRYAMFMGGVFVNPAYNEPFGLTLLEAAASGLPVVATNSGGPNDILERCENGVLIDPHDEHMIAARIEELVTDRACWRQLSEAGGRNSAYYSWTRHTRDYIASLRQWMKRSAPRIVAARPRRGLLASDIDNTLIGNRAAVQRFSKWLDSQDSHHFAIATGRSLHSALQVLEQWEAPMPDVLVTSVGTEIYYTTSAGTLEADEAWKENIEDDWQPESIANVLAEIEDLVPQGRTEQRPFKLSYFMPNDERLLTRVKQLLDEAGLAASIIYSHGRYLDILPVRASKGKAIHFLAASLGLPFGNVMAAGDSGNDLDMLEVVRKPIVVANHADELEPLRDNPRAFFAGRSYADGVLEGIERHTKSAEEHADLASPNSASLVRAALQSKNRPAENPEQ